jgi:hypothetical protein
MYTFFTPARPDSKLETVLVYAAFEVDACLHSFGSEFLPIIDGCFNREGDVTGTIHSYARQGHRLVGMGIVGGSAAASFQGTNSSSLAELVFQKDISSPSIQVSISQATIQVKVKNGNIKSRCPDFLTFLNDMGSKGYELSGFLLTPAPPPSDGAMTFELNIPVYIMMQKQKNRVYRFAEAQFSYSVQVSMSGAFPKVTGDPVPLIKSYAAKGWLLKGAIALPGQRKGTTNMVLPFGLIFQTSVPTE